MSTMTKLMIHIPVAMKKQLDGLRSQGYTASGYIRALLERELCKPNKGKKWPIQ
ncbi:MAG: hypothetical protein ACQ9IQ_11765 [Nitrospirales bacterium]